MAKEKTMYVCADCGYETPRWMGKCPGCGAWNTLEEQAPQTAQAAPVKAIKQRPGTGALALRLDLPSECLKLISATIVALAIGLPAIKNSLKPATAQGGKNKC